MDTLLLSGDIVPKPTGLGAAWGAGFDTFIGGTGNCPPPCDMFMCRACLKHHVAKPHCYLQCHPPHDLLGCSVCIRFAASTLVGDLSDNWQLPVFNA